METTEAEWIHVPGHKVHGVVARLIERSAWFLAMPLPDNYWQIDVKPEHMDYVKASLR
ncbi:hypothetical protein LCGC14_0143230 [marine sediment metagenome]|uniref:Uncharacterized protein n=1 Tax=marine sediment metagenome TaxID=412755 RepID=A0A0F9V1D8_9ZZZZ